MNQQLLEIASILAANGASREQIVETVEKASGPGAQRQLLPEEYDVFAGAVARAVQMMPSFRDAVALIRPFRDYTSPTLYTDKHSRVGIGTLFFLPSVTPHRRASLLLHEAMHILNNHFTRQVKFTIDPDSDNRAKDLEINSLLNRHKQTDLSMLLLPEQAPYNFPDYKSYEQYAQLMKDKGLIAQEPTLGAAEQPQPSGQPPTESPEESAPGSAEKPEGASQPGEKDPNADPAEGQPGDSSEEKSEGSEGSPSDSESESDDKPEKGEQDSGSPLGSEEDSDDSTEASGGSGSDADSSESDSESESADGSESEGDGDSSADEAESIAEEALSEGSEGKPPSAHSSSCDHSTSEREKVADDLNIERASSSEQSVARSNTMARVREEAAKSKARGDRAALMMLQQMELAMEPSKVDWRVIFRNIISNSRDAISMGRSDHTYRRVNKRMSTGEFIFPGMIRYDPSAIMAVDTSGSMSKEDFAYLLSELETIVKSVLRSKDKFRAFCVDAKAAEPQTVRKIQDLNLLGGGGTKMEMAVRSIELLPKKEIPDIFILATDGGTDWNAFKRELLKSKHSYKTVVLITQDYTFENAKNTLQDLATVIDISEQGTGEIGR